MLYEILIMMKNHYLGQTVTFLKHYNAYNSSTKLTYDKKK